MEEANDVFGLAAELCAQVRPLCRNAGRTGVQMALARHVAAKRDKHGCAEGVFVSTKQRGNHDVTRGAQAAIGAKTNSSAETIVDQDLLRFREAEFPWVAGVLNARKRRGARATCVSRDDD